MSKYDRDISGTVISLEDLRGSLTFELQRRAANTPRKAIYSSDPVTLEADRIALEAAGEENYDLAARQKEQGYAHAVEVFGEEIAKAMYADCDTYTPQISPQELQHVERTREKLTAMTGDADSSVTLADFAPD